METKFNFNSQICTTRLQSERLLALGLKKETSDCFLFEYDKEKYKVIAESWLNLIADEKYYSQYKDVCIPAWSLHRLLCIVNLYTAILRRKIKTCHKSFEEKDNLYDNLIDCIEWLIKEGYFNKEYLEE